MPTPSLPSTDTAEESLTADTGYEPTGADGYVTAPEPVARDTIEAERTLVAFSLAHPDAVSADVLALPPEYMSSDRNAAMWTVAVERAHAGAEFDTTDVARQLRDRYPEYRSIGEQAVQLAVQRGIGMPGVVAETLVDEISKGHVARRTEQTLIAAWQRLSVGRADLARDLMAGIDPTEGVYDPFSTLSASWAAAQDDAQNPAAVLPLPWPKLSAALGGGLRARSVTVLAGLSGTGKTASAQQVIDYLCADGRTVAIFSLELGRTDYARRQIATSGRIEMAETMRPALDMSAAAWAEADRAINGIGERVLIDDSTDLTAQQLRSRARLAVRRHGAECLVVDYAQLVGHENERLTEREQITKVVEQITKMAKELDVPVLLLAQPNRNAQIAGRPLELADLHGSSALEKFAGSVILLNREWDTDDDGNRIPTEFVSFDIRKSRFAANDVSVRTVADLSRQRFEEL